MYTRITDEIIRALHAALKATTVGPDEYLKQPQYEGKVPAQQAGPLFCNPSSSGSSRTSSSKDSRDKYRDIKRTTYTDPEYGLRTIQATMCHVCIDDSSSSKGKVRFNWGVAVSVASAPDTRSTTSNS